MQLLRSCIPPVRQLRLFANPSPCARGEDHHGQNARKLAQHRCGADSARPSELMRLRRKAATASLQQPRAADGQTRDFIRNQFRGQRNFDVRNYKTENKKQQQKGRVIALSGSLVLPVTLHIGSHQPRSRLLTPPAPPASAAARVSGDSPGAPRSFPTLLSFFFPSFFRSFCDLFEFITVVFMKNPIYMLFNTTF